MSLISELKRRRVFRVAGMYGVTAWVITEVSSTVLPALHLPEQLITIIVVLLIAGFPIAMILAWIFDLGPQGIERTEPDVAVLRKEQITNKLTLVAAVVISTAVLGSLFLWRLSYVAPPPRDSIAVLPFVNLAGTADSDFFSDGISEELLNLLANVPGLKVAARTSSFAFKNQNQDIRSIGEQLGVATVLEGSVRYSKDAKQVRITAQLIDAASGYHLWSDTYDRQLEDIFAVQDEIASAIVANLQLQLESGEDMKTLPEVAPPTQNIEAYTLYLKGRALWNQRGEDSLNRSVALFEAALVLDPNFARANANLAAAYVLLPAYGEVSQDEYFVKASEAALAALAIDERLAESHAVLAHISDQKWQWKDAETSFYFATSLDPGDPTSHHWYSIHLSTVGRLQEALEEAQIAAELDKNSGVIQANLALMLEFAGRHEEAVQAAQRAGSLGFANGTAGLLADISRRNGDIETALEQLRQSPTVDPRRVALLESVTTSSNDPSATPSYNNDAEAFFFAAAQGQLDQAFTLAQSLTDNQSLPMKNLWDPALRAFRNDPRFAKLMRDTGLVEYWRRYGWAEFCGDDPMTRCAVEALENASI